MIELTRLQTICHDGLPAFVVMPFVDFAREFPKEAEAIKPKGPWVPDSGVPHAVVGLHIKDGMTLLRAWREYLGMTQTEIAEKVGISQAALSQMENGGNKLRKGTREKLASALGIKPSQLL